VTQHGEMLPKKCAEKLCRCGGKNAIHAQKGMLSTEDRCQRHTQNTNCIQIFGKQVKCGAKWKLFQAISRPVLKQKFGFLTVFCHCHVFELLSDV